LLPATQMLPASFLNPQLGSLHMLQFGLGILIYVLLHAHYLVVGNCSGYFLY